jgi:hypothetical protein
MNLSGTDLSAEFRRWNFPNTDYEFWPSQHGIYFVPECIKCRFLNVVDNINGDYKLEM